jgi:PAS domain-containing protein
MTKQDGSEGAERNLALLQAALDATAEGILIVDLQGKIASFNRRFAEMWKMPEALAAS